MKRNKFIKIKIKKNIKNKKIRSKKKKEKRKKEEGHQTEKQIH